MESSSSLRASLSTWAQSIRSSRKHANQIISMFHVIRNSDECALILYGLRLSCDVLVDWIKSGCFRAAKQQTKRRKSMVGGEQEEKSAEAIFADWASHRLDELLLLLRRFIHCGEPGLENPCVDMYMSLVDAKVKECKSFDSAAQELGSGVFAHLIDSLLGVGWDDQEVEEDSEDAFDSDALDYFLSSYVAECRDIQFYLLRNLMKRYVHARVSTTTEKSPSLLGLMKCLLHASMIMAPSQFSSTRYLHEDSDFVQDRKRALSISAKGNRRHKKKRSTSEMDSTSTEDSTDSSLGFPCLLDVGYRRMFQSLVDVVLTSHERYPTLSIEDFVSDLDQKILPQCHEPKLLMDALYALFCNGGVLGMLSLGGLYVLITKHNLDYPKFFHQFYSLLRPELFVSKYRHRFFSQLSSILTSRLLPQNMVASFMKKLLRISTISPPFVSAFLLPLLYNMLRRHPNCMSLIHQGSLSITSDSPSLSKTEEMRDGEDRFLVSETDPMSTHAAESSAWELDALRVHYHPTVARLSNSFAQPPQPVDFDLSPFTDLSYTKLVDRELQRGLFREVPMREDLSIRGRTPRSLFQSVSSILVPSSLKVKQ